MTHIPQGRVRRVRHKDLLRLQLDWHHDAGLLWSTVQRLGLVMTDRVFSTEVEGFGSLGFKPSNNQCLCGDRSGWNDDGVCPGCLTLPSQLRSMLTSFCGTENKNEVRC